MPCRTEPVQVGNLRRNTLWVMAEFGTATLVQFFVLRTIVHQLGAAQLGVWAVLMAAAQIAGFLDFGLTAGVSRYLARVLHTGDTREIERILAIIVRITVPLYLAVSVLIYAATWLLLPHIVDPALVAGARGVLPYSTAAYFVLVLSIASGSCLTALHLGYRKSQLFMVGLVLQGMLAWAWVGRHGLAGMAGAQLANYLLVIAGTLLLLKRTVRVRLGGLLHLDRERAREVMRFGAGLQLPSLAWVMFETSIRFAMARFGGAAVMGRYEIAYRVSAQARVLFFYVAQPLGPALVARAAEGADAFVGLFRTVYARFTLLALLVALGVTAASPLVSWIMLGSIDPRFVVFAALTAGGAAFQIWAMPSENAAVAQGVIRYNAAGTSAAVLTMLVLGIPLGLVAGGYGVAGAVLVGSALAGIIPVLGNARALGLPLRPSWAAGLAGLPRLAFR